MEIALGLALAVIVLMFLANSKKKAPKAVKELKSSTIWGIDFFDRNKWLKKILIFLAKTGTETIFLVWRLISMGIEFGTPSLIKKIKKGF
ncbi:MAG: hypothetical protein WCX80_04720 [Patescibacteria group bacterium]